MTLKYLSFPIQKLINFFKFNKNFIQNKKYIKVTLNYIYYCEIMNEKTLINFLWCAGKEILPYIRSKPLVGIHRYILVLLYIRSKLPVCMSYI